MEATNKSGEIVPLQYLQASKAMSILGMYPALDGNNKDQVKYMHKKACAWKTSIRVGGFEQNKAWKALNSKITQNMKYPLPAMTPN